MVLAPVLPISRLAATLELSEQRFRELIDRLEIPHLDADGIVLVDAGICERAARRALGDDAGDAVHRARGGDPARRVAVPATALRAAKQPTPTELDLDWENVEEVLRAALAEHGCVLSYPLYRRWCAVHGQRPRSIESIRHALGVKTWTEALAACGGRRGVTTPTDRAEALELIAAALADHDGRLRMRDYPRWARERN